MPNEPSGEPSGLDAGEGRVYISPESKPKMEIPENRFRLERRFLCSSMANGQQMKLLRL
jgi:hypothetical protein